MSKTIEKAFGKALRELREKRGLSQEGFGFECDLHRTYISLIERGFKNPSLKTIIKLSKALSIKPSELIKKFEKHLGRIES